MLARRTMTVILFAFLVACARHPASETVDAAPGAMIYACPMHPEVVSDRLIQCPKCDMWLELRRDAGARSASGDADTIYHGLLR